MLDTDLIQQDSYVLKIVSSLTKGHLVYSNAYLPKKESYAACMQVSVKKSSALMSLRS